VQYGQFTILTIMGLSKISTSSFTTTVPEIKFTHRAAEPFSLNASAA
jgi:hypothetical protein